MNQYKNVIVEAVSQFWDERQGRERQYIIAAAVVLVIALVYLIGIDPAITGRQELSKQLPVLQRQSIEMQQMAKELRALPSPDNLQDIDRDTIDSSLSKNNLKPESVSVVEGVVRIQINSTSMAALQTWLLEVQKSSALFVREIKLTGLEGGLVSTTLVLQQAAYGG